MSEKKFGFIDKLAYAMGDFGCNMSFVLNTYLMLFYTQYIGLSLKDWGIIILVLKIWDGVNDPIMGGLMDSLKPGKMGKFKTYIFYGSFLLIVSGALCFLPIPEAPYWVKAMVCIVGYLFWDMSYTIVNVPYGAMSSAITADPIERSELSTWRTLGSYAANLVIMVLLPMLCYDNDNNLIGNRIFIIALFLGALGFLAFQFMLKYTTERVTVEDEKKENYDYLKSIKAFLNNRAALGVTLTSIITIILSNSMSNATQVLYQSFFKNSRISGILGIVNYVPTVLLMLVTKPLVKRYGKKEISTYTMLLGVLCGVLIAFLPIKPDKTGLIIYVILSTLITASTGMFGILCWAMVADAIDYQELKTGKREEGTVYATYSLGRKLAQGFGSSIIAFLLLMTGYVSENGAAQTFEVANNVRIMIGLTNAIGLLLAFVVSLFVNNLDKKTLEDMERRLGRN